MLGRLVCWGGWYVGEAGMLGRLVCWGSWYIGGPGILGRLVCWAGACPGAAMQAVAAPFLKCLPIIFVENCFLQQQNIL